MNRLRKETMKENLEKLDPQEHAQIFSVIKSYTQDYTNTQSGVLVSSDSLSEKCLVEIEKMIMYYLDQRNRIDFNRK